MSPGTSRATRLAANFARRLATVQSLAQIDDLLGTLDGSQPYPGADAEGQRGRAGSPKSPALPHRWLDSRELQETDRSELTEAELSTSGG